MMLVVGGASTIFESEAAAISANVQGCLVLCPSDELPGKMKRSRIESLFEEEGCGGVINAVVNREWVTQSLINQTLMDCRSSEFTFPKPI